MTRVALVTGVARASARPSRDGSPTDGYAVAVTGRRPEPIEAVAQRDRRPRRHLPTRASRPTRSGRSLRRSSGSAASTRSSSTPGIGGEGSLLDVDPETFETRLQDERHGRLPDGARRDPAPPRTAWGDRQRRLGRRAPGAPASLAYCSSKAALAMLTQCIALDHGPAGVRANCVCPGWVRTPMADGEMDWLAEQARRLPRGRLRRGDGRGAVAAPELARGDRRHRRLAPLRRCVVRQRRRDPRRRWPHDGRRRHDRVREGRDDA